MRKAVAGSLAVIWMAFGTLSCSTLKGKEKGVAIGAATGAAVGTAIGIVVGNQRENRGAGRSKGAAIGGVFGGIIGGALGGMLSKEEPPPPPPPPPPPVEKKEVPPPPPPPEVKEETPPPPPPPPPVEEKKEVPPPPPPPAAEEKKEVPPLPKRVVLSDVLFDFDKSTLKPTAYPILKEVVDYLKANPSVKLSIEGHTDSIGSKAYNQALSLRRVRSVKKYLVSHEIEEGRLSVEGFGESHPVASNKTKEGRRLNRRVEFKASM